MFNTHFPDLAQLLALPLELVGLLLASTELFAPAKAARIDAFIRARGATFGPRLQLPLTGLMIPFMVYLALGSVSRGDLWQTLGFLFAVTMSYAAFVMWFATVTRPERAVGMSGVVIAGTGLALEAYQVGVYLTEF